MTIFKLSLKKLPPCRDGCKRGDDRPSMRCAPGNSLVWLIAGLILCFTACDKFDEEPGVVARVNGRPIRLSQLQREYEASHQPVEADAGIEMGRLREQYGAALAALAVRELVDEELERQGLGVTPEELEKAEAEARADYREEGAFEQVLAEEYIDIDQWREQLRGRLASEQLKRLVLRPGVVIEPAEAQAFYRERQAEFGSPERVRVLRLTGSDRARLEERLRAAARGALQASPRPENRKEERQEEQGGAGNESRREITARLDRLPEAWRKALRGLSPGQASPIFGERSAWQGLVLLERIPARPPDPAQDYPLVERLLLERKLEEAQDAWIASALRRAKVTASPELVRKEARPKEKVVVPNP